MVTTNINPSQPINMAQNQISGILGFFARYWIVILVFILLIVAIAIIIILRKQQLLEREERDSEAFAMYNTVRADCMANADKKLIRKNYSFINLLWLGIPFVWKDHSAKLRDIDGKLIGFYRGHFDSQDGCRNYLVYKTKSLGFFENLFIIRYQKMMTFKSNVKNGKEIKVNLQLKITKDKYNDDLWFQATGIQKVSIYYHTPNFVYNDVNREVMDLRKELHKAIMDDSWKLAYERSINQNTQNMRKAIDGNPFVQAKKQTGEIEQENREIKQEEQY